MDASKFKSKKTGRGLLKKGWQKEADPVMCCYKLVTANFKYWGLQGTVEGKIENQDRELFTVHIHITHTSLQKVTQWFRCVRRRMWRAESWRQRGQGETHFALCLSVCLCVCLCACSDVTGSSILLDRRVV